MKVHPNEHRISILQKYYREEGHSAIHLTQAPNLYWLLGGRVQVGVAGTTGICEAIINDDGLFIITNNIESQRLIDEEFGDTGAQYIVHPWSDSADKTIVSELLGSTPMIDTQYPNALRTIRSVLDSAQERELRSLCRDAAEVMENACVAVQKGMSEWKIASLVAKECYERAMEPIVLFAACDQRLFAYRHALSTNNPFEQLCMISLGARRVGLHTSITRMIGIGSQSDEYMRRMAATHSLAAMLYEQSTPGSSYSSLYAKLAAKYRAQGYEQELALHHQGGLAGWQVREVKITADTKGEVLANQVYAWNPSITGYKVEDTLWVGEHGNEILTHTPNLPYVQVASGDSSWDMHSILIH